MGGESGRQDCRGHGDRRRPPGDSRTSIPWSGTIHGEDHCGLTPPWAQPPPPAAFFLTTAPSILGHPQPPPQVSSVPSLQASEATERV